MGLHQNVPIIVVSEFGPPLEVPEYTVCRMHLSTKCWFKFNTWTFHIDKQAPGNDDRLHVYPCFGSLDSRQLVVVGLSSKLRCFCRHCELVPRRRRGGRVLDRQCVAWASGGVGAERRAACDAACESLGTWI